VGTDGASVMRGVHGGLTVKMCDEAAPFLQSSHCAAHRVSLASNILEHLELVQRLQRAAQVISTHFCKSPRRLNIYEEVTSPFYTWS
jgi:hypothetical protein